MPQEEARQVFERALTDQSLVWISDDNSGVSGAPQHRITEMTFKLATRKYVFEVPGTRLHAFKRNSGDVSGTLPTLPLTPLDDLTMCQAICDHYYGRIEFKISKVVIKTWKVRGLKTWFVVFDNLSHRIVIEGAFCGVRYMGQSDDCPRGCVCHFCRTWDAPLLRIEPATCEMELEPATSLLELEPSVASD